jgi:hypothetical protein
MPDELNTDTPAAGEVTESFLDIDTSDVPDVKILPEGECLVELTKVTQGLSKKGNPMITSVFVVPNEPAVEAMYTYTNLPTAGLDERQNVRNLRGLKEWKQALGLPPTGSIDLAGLGDQGIRVYAYLTVEEYEGRKSNRIQSLTRPE